MQKIKVAELAKTHAAAKKAGGAALAGPIAAPDPLNIFVQAISNAKPIIGTVPLRKGGSVYRVPGALTPKRRQALAIKWIVAAARKRSGKPMADRLYTEIMDAYNGTGAAIAKKLETHKMAESNRAYLSLVRR